MKLLYLFLLIGLNSTAQSSKNISLLDHWFVDTLLTTSSKVYFNDCWGYHQNGQEFAMIGSTEGTHFFHITSDNHLKPVDYLPGQYQNANAHHRDIKTYKNYAFISGDEGNASIQVVDLSYLPDSIHVVANLTTGYGRVHNLFVDESNALLYACAFTPIVNDNPTSLIPMRVYSIQDPSQPQLLFEGPNDLVEVHDCYVRNSIAYLNCGFDGLRVYDFSDPSNPIYIQNIDNYQDQGYNHQGWMSPNGQYYLFADETDGKRIKKCRVNNDHTVTIQQRFGTNYLNNSVPHNITLTDDYIFVAYYNEGLRVYNLNGNPKEIAHYDTYPDDHFFKQNGAWGIYSDLPSKRL